MSGTTPELQALVSGEMVVAAIRDALPMARVVGPPERMPKGFSSESWRVATDNGELVIKIRRQMTDAAKLRSQVEGARLAWAAGVPTAEVLYAGLSEVVGDRPTVILRYVPGVDAEEVLPALDTSQRDQLFAAFGAAVGQLHRIRLPYFTDRIGTPQANVADWATVVSRVAERYAAWNHDVAVLTVQEIGAIRDRLIQDAAGVSSVVEPTLTHRDLYLANVLTDEGRFVALIDFELARGYEPLLDFIKLGMFVFERWPTSFEPFMAVYRLGDRHNPRALERLTICLALEHFVQLLNWVQFGEGDLVRYSRDRLRDWLRGSYPWWLQRIGEMLR